MTRFLLVLYWVISLTAGFAQDRGFKPVQGGTAPKGTERRLALVVGNATYTTPGLSLKNPTNDAADISAALDKLGFRVIQVKDADYRTLVSAINDFTDQLRKQDVGLFYYSGHGIGYQNENYLVPIDANLTYENQVASQCVSLRRLTDGMAGAGNPNNFVFLDACRNNTLLPNQQRGGVANGLTIPTNNPERSYLVFSTQPGRTASDNAGDRNCLFTGELLKYLTQPNLGVRAMLDQTVRGVRSRSNGAQVPGRYDELEGDFVFVQTATLPTKVEPARPVSEVITPTRTEPTRPAPVTDLPVGPAMVYVKGGTFSMGSNEGQDDEKPVHDVQVSDFLMGKYEVTISEFSQFVEATNYQTDAEQGDGSDIQIRPETKFEKKAGANWRHDEVGNLRSRSEYTHPVIHVSHNDAVAYCGWLSKRTGKIYRLPTEAEWEYAAGGGTAHCRYSWGNSEPLSNPSGNIADQSTSGILSETSASFSDGYKYTAPVGKFAPNSFGLYDMSGNVWEWCADWYNDKAYETSSNLNSAGPTSGTYRVIRGGSWYLGLQRCRVAGRGVRVPMYRNSGIGFRVVSQLQ